MLPATLLSVRDSCLWTVSGRRPFCVGWRLLGFLFAVPGGARSVHPATLPGWPDSSLAWALATTVSRPRSPVYRVVIYVWSFCFGISSVFGFGPAPLLGTVPAFIPARKTDPARTCPPLVWAPSNPIDGGWGSSVGRTSCCCCRHAAGVDPLALLWNPFDPAGTTLRSSLTCGLAYNLVFRLLLRESFFRGIVQTG